MTNFFAGAGATSAAGYPTFTSSYPIEAIISSLEAPEATLACICAWMLASISPILMPEAAALA